MCSNVAYLKICLNRGCSQMFALTLILTSSSFFFFINFRSFCCWFHSRPFHLLESNYEWFFFLFILSSSQCQCESVYSKKILWLIIFTLNCGYASFSSLRIYLSLYIIRLIHSFEILCVCAFFSLSVLSFHLLIHPSINNNYRAIDEK